MRRPAKVISTISVPFFGASAEWTPSAAEREAAWELLVEITTRTTVADLANDEGSDRAVLTSLHSLFSTTREVLREHGAATAEDPRNGNLSLATITLRLLNDVLRPFLTVWHPIFVDDANAIEATPAGAQPSADAVRIHHAFRSELFEVRSRMREYVFVLGRASGTTHFAAQVDAAVRGSAAQDLQVFAEAEPAEGSLLGNPRPHMTRWLAPTELVGSARRLGPTDDRSKTQCEVDAGVSWGQGAALITIQRWTASLIRWLKRKEATREPVGYGNVDSSFADIDEVWFDYAADMGDAFDPTMHIAWLLGRERLSVGRTATSTEVDLPRGDFLVLGGDEIYPYATAKIYRNQLDTPYALAMQPTNEQAVTGRHPQLFAIPGNHDWYGGLHQWSQRFTTSGSGMFPPGSSKAGWEITQDASWFAAELPHGWWIWGIDTFLDGSIDESQRAFFANVDLQPGDRVILCAPVPAWRLREKHPGDLVTLDQFVEDCIDSREASAKVFLSGDSHLFASFTRRPRRTDRLEHHVTSGGAGAFLQPTHNIASIVPQTAVPSPQDIDPALFVDGEFWPPPRASHKIITGNALRQVWDRQSPGLLILLAGIYLGYAWPAGGHIVSEDTDGWWSAVATTLVSLVWKWPGWLATTILVLVMIGFGFGVARPNTKETRVVRFAARAGVVHGLAQGAGVFLVAAITHYVADRAGLGRWFPLAVGAPVAALVATALMMIYLSRVNRNYRVNDNEAFSFRHLMDAKHFLRCNIDKSGDLTIRLIAVDEIRRGWAKAIKNGDPLPPGLALGKRAVAHVPWQKTIGYDIEPLQFGLDQNRWVAISVSDPQGGERDSIAAMAKHIADAVLALGCHLAYGGNARKYGYTEQFVTQSRQVRTPQAARVRNYQATAVLSPEEIGDITGVESIRIDEPLDRACQLTAMRERMAEETFARIVLGGRTEARNPENPGGYGGKMPGVQEEAQLTVDAGAGLFVLAGFGGAAALVHEELKASGEWSQLANGLCRCDNDALAATTEPHRVIHFVVKGLTELYRRDLAGGSHTADSERPVERCAGCDGASSPDEGFVGHAAIIDG